jgi:hypothetical protein
VDIFHAFLLTVWLGVGEDKRKVSSDMYFRSVDRCVYFAQRLHKQGGDVTSVCIPVIVGPDQKVYD